MEEFIKVQIMNWWKYQTETKSYKTKDGAERKCNRYFIKLDVNFLEDSKIISLKSCEVLVFLYLKLQSAKQNFDGICEISVSHGKISTKNSKKNFIKCIESLENAGLISRKIQEISRKIPYRIREEKNRIEKEEIAHASPDEGNQNLLGPEDIKTIWNNAARGKMPKVKILTPGRIKHIKAQIKLNGDPEHWAEVVTKISHNDFLNGTSPSQTHPNFKATIDWILKPDNRAKVLEGNYDNKTQINWANLTAEESALGRALGLTLEERLDAKKQNKDFKEYANAKKSG